MSSTNRLFIFAIGGTGSRVLKALTMLLASGVRPNSQQQFEIVPIIIDPHRTGDSIKRTERLLNNYQAITDAAGLENGFFGTKITTLNKIASEHNRLSDNFTFEIQEIADSTFKDYIGYNQLSPATKALSNLLFSGQTVNAYNEKVDLLNIEMDIGFIGNPNIGSVVLNQFKDSEEFKEIASSFNENDRIFIISSIFGGTGAAGFPTILKNIRGAIENVSIDSKGFLTDAKIGALTVLPYFNIEKDHDSPIQKSDFIAKTKAALSYYKDNIARNNSLNALYYIADDFNGKPYRNDPGSNSQRNPAHFVELASALAVIDFLEIPDGNLACEEGKAINPVYKEFGVKHDVPEVNFAQLGDLTNKKIRLRLSQFLLFQTYLENQIIASTEREAWSMDKHEIDRHFLNKPFYGTNLSEFVGSFESWLREMADNRRGFSPFNLDSELSTMIKNVTVKNRLFSSKIDYKYFDSRLNKHSHRKTYVSPEQKLLTLFYQTTEDILISKFGLNP